MLELFHEKVRESTDRSMLLTSSVTFIETVLSAEGTREDSPKGKRNQ